MRIVLLSILATLIFSCGKTPLMDEAPDLAGIWTHYTNETDHHVLYIYSDGTGKLEWYNHNGLHKDTKIRDWYIKDNRMYFGKVALDGQFYDIIDYPMVAGTGFSSYYDTIPPGARYCKLDDVTYVELP